MKTSIKCLPILVATTLIGCVAPGGHIKAGDPSLVTVGMAREQVLERLGKPESVSADGKSETFTYILERPWWQDRPFRVRILDGHVTSFEVAEH